MEVPNTISFGAVLDAVNQRLAASSDSQVRQYLSCMRQRTQSNLLRVLTERRAAQPAFWTDVEDAC